jgi:uncharacterized lipoprotein YddW (UPF0748 family)
LFGSKQAATAATARAEARIPPLIASQSRQQQPPPPGRRSANRGVWVATVNNLDYPKKPGTWPIAYREEWKNLLAQYKALGINAVIFQIRPAADAFYPSAHAPWSAYLTGKQGLPPEQEYDLLQFLIEETHHNGMEFHAWLNPYRATMNLDTASLSAQHVFNRHRDWVVRYGTRFYLNPGIPQVREHIREVVAEVVQKYPVDAIHFDDYFYPYPLTNQEFPDSTTFKVYAKGEQDINAWRRRNVDELVEMVSLTIKENKPNMYFGISPFGVWRNERDDPAGSATRAGVPSYDAVHADVLNWLRRGWIDYVVPQLYWHIGFEPADHAVLQRWWSQNSFGKQLYIGHAAYKVGNDSQEAWYDPAEMSRQIRLARRNSRIGGSVYFRSTNLLGGPLGLKDSLRFYYQAPALLPVREDLELGVFNAPALGKVRNKQGDALICWRPAKEDRDKPPHYYVLYRFSGPFPGDIDDPRNIAQVTPFAANQRKIKFTDTKVENGKVYTYGVTALNQAHSESRLSIPQTVTRDKGRVKKYQAPSDRKKLALLKSRR